MLSHVAGIPCPIDPPVCRKPMFPGAVSWLLVSLIAAFCLSSSARAQQEVVDKRLVLSVVPTHGICRGHAPLSLSVILSWKVPELIEGDLQLDWYLDTTRLGRSVIPNLALSDSSLNLPVTLPPVAYTYEDAVCSVQAKFLTSHAVYDLDVFDIALQPDWRRALVVGICGDPPPLVTSPADLLAKEQQRILPRSFDLASFFQDRFENRELVVHYADVEPRNVPTDPLRMTGFDLFVVPGDAVARLKPTQRDCLLQWVRAGGSLCVIIETPLPESHLTWLNQLAGRDRAHTAYLRDADGRIVPAETVPERIHQHFVGLGRAVVTLQPPDLDRPHGRKRCCSCGRCERTVETSYGKAASGKRGPSARSFPRISIPGFGLRWLGGINIPST